MTETPVTMTTLPNKNISIRISASFWIYIKFNSIYYTHYSMLLGVVCLFHEHFPLNENSLSENRNSYIIYYLYEHIIDTTQHRFGYTFHEHTHCVC